jgi:hypothetical protein
MKRTRTDKRVLATNSTGELTVQNADEAVSYAGLSIDEWIAANIRVPFCLLQEGKLSHPGMDSYLAYTVMIMEVVKVYDWHSTLAYYARNRETQARINCTWGTMGEQLRCQTLIPKARTTHNETFNSEGSNGKKQKNDMGNREKSTEMYRQWALDKCNFGEEKCHFTQS